MGRRSRTGIWLATICAAATLGAAPAQGAFGDPLFVVVPTPPAPPSPTVPPPTGYFNGPCGAAIRSNSNIYISDYYHHAIDAYDPGEFPLTPPGFVTQIGNVDPLGGPCGLAFDSSDNLYVNNHHRNVMKSPPSGTIIASGHTTGVAVDIEDNVYVNKGTHIEEYNSSGEAVQQIGVGTLEDGYGLAVSHYVETLGYVYVPDAGSDTVKIYDPLTDVVNPVAEIDGADTPSGEFVSLRESAVAVDKYSGDVYVADNNQPAHTERPQATIHVYSDAGVYEGHLKYNIVDALPPGLAVDNTTNFINQGRVYVTSGNTHEAGVYVYAAGSATTDEPLPSSFSLAVNAAGGGSGKVASQDAELLCSDSCATELRSGREVTLEATADPGSAFAGFSGAGCEGSATCTVTMDESKAVSAHFAPTTGPPAPSGGASAATASSAPRATASEIVQKGTLRVSTSGDLSPKRLPRRGTAPIAVLVGGKFTTTDESLPPQLKALRIELNRHGRLETRGLPRCRLNQIQPASTRRALRVCRPALVGTGSFSLEAVLSGQEPYPTRGRLLVFNGKYKGRPALLGQIYSARPFATSFVIPFRISQKKRGKYGLILNATLPPAMASWGHITGLELKLKRLYRYRGRKRSVVSAGCPAPKGFPGALFPLARTTFRFAGGIKVSSGLTRSCKVRG